jgi:3-hydroxybutyryl-CoA dehydrogenase
VIGVRLMGHGIAQVAAQAGYDVVVREVDEATLAKGIGRISKQLGRAVEKGTLDEATADEVRGRIHGTLAYEDLADCDLVVEAIIEDLGLKLDMSFCSIARIETSRMREASSGKMPTTSVRRAISRLKRSSGLVSRMKGPDACCDPRPPRCLGRLGW